MPRDLTQGQLHVILQTAMGWHDSHLHHFVVNGMFFSIPSPDDFEPVRDERRVELFQIAPGVKTKFVYDLGDSWEHVIVVEKSLAPEPRAHYPVCIKGKKAKATARRKMWGRLGLRRLSGGPAGPHARRTYRRPGMG
jgi:hypothetical protein